MTEYILVAGISGLVFGLSVGTCFGVWLRSW